MARLEASVISVIAVTEEGTVTEAREGQVVQIVVRAGVSSPTTGAGKAKAKTKGRNRQSDMSAAFGQQR